jgi:hypothetical protein
MHHYNIVFRDVLQSLSCDLLDTLLLDGIIV